MSTRPQRPQRQQGSFKIEKTVFKDESKNYLKLRNSEVGCIVWRRAESTANADCFDKVLLSSLEATIENQKFQKR